MYEHHIGQYYDIESVEAAIYRLQEEGWELVNMGCSTRKYDTIWFYAMKRLKLPTAETYNVD